MRNKHTWIAKCTSCGNKSHVRPIKGRGPVCYSCLPRHIRKLDSEFACAYDKAIPLISIKNQTECQEWKGPLSEGYGKMAWEGERLFVHRVVYEHRIGKIPEGMTIDHLCRNRKCQNTDHLEVVSIGENCRRRTRLILSCKHGHEFTPENTRYDSKGRRCCRSCARAAWHKHKKGGSNEVRDCA
jgi:hypothetical protein